MAKKARKKARAAGRRPLEPLPPLRAEDRLSHYVDYASIVPGYQQLVAAEGEATVREALDQLFYLLGESFDLLDEGEFEDLKWRLEAHDYLVYELFYHVQKLREQDLGLDGLGPALADERARHMVSDGLRRYFTLTMRRDVQRRARILARRRPGTLMAAEAEAVALATRDPQISLLLVGLLVESFRKALLQAVLDLPDVIDREWEQRDRRLDRWLEALHQADAEHPAEEAVQRLQQAGAAALPLAAHLYWDEQYTCDDYPLQAALEVVAPIAAPQSLWLLRETIVSCPDLYRWAVEHLAASMPELACAYFRYLLTDRHAPDAALVTAGLLTVAAAGCPGAFDLASAALRYQAGDALEMEMVQATAGEALLALGDRAAVPVLRAYLADEQANPAAREHIVEALRSERGHGWWEEIVKEQPPQAAR